MRWDNYRGAEKVYAWSFYSQGTSERVTSADLFINQTLEWFGDADPKQGSPWDKGKRLARLINDHKTLLTCFTSQHGSKCKICMDEVIYAHKLYKEGRSMDEIVLAIDKKFYRPYRGRRL